MRPHRIETVFYQGANDNKKGKEKHSQDLLNKHPIKLLSGSISREIFFNRFFIL